MVRRFRRVLPFCHSHSMKTIQLVEPGMFVAADLPETSAPAAGEALVRVHRIGVCGIDIQAFGGLA